MPDSRVYIQEMLSHHLDDVGTAGRFYSSGKHLPRFDKGYPVLAAGDHAPLFHFKSPNFILRDKVGAPQLLLFQGSDENPENLERLRALQKASADFDAAGVKIVSLSPDSYEARSKTAQENGLSYMTLGDFGCVIAELYGLCEKEANDPSTAFLLDQNLMIIGVLSPFTVEQIPMALSAFQACCPKKEPYVVSDPYTPPVLLIPDIFDLKTCQDIIDVWETQGNQVSHFMKRDGDKTYGVVDDNVKIRRDHFVRDEKIKEWINSYLQRRVYSEIMKCFNYDVHEYEHFKIACYDSKTGGYFRPHRDNTAPGTAHRVWALSVNLNDDYEGGYLRFPEYGPQLYKPAPGSGVVFSCSLMHEATDVTAGKRYALLSFFYGEAESKARADYMAKHGTESYIPKEVLES